MSRNDRLAQIVQRRSGGECIDGRFALGRAIGASRVGARVLAVAAFAAGCRGRQRQSLPTTAVASARRVGANQFWP